MIWICITATIVLLIYFAVWALMKTASDFDDSTCMGDNCNEDCPIVKAAKAVKDASIGDIDGEEKEGR